MSKIAIVVLCDTAGNEALGRIVNTLTAAKEFQEAGDQVKVVFTGVGTRWVGQLARPDHKLHSLYRDVRGHVAGACAYCAGAFDATDAVQSADVRLLEEYGANMSFRQLIEDGYQVLTF